MELGECVGLHINAAGQVLACDEGRVWDAGSVRMDARGCPDLAELRALVEAMGLCGDRCCCISCDLSDFASVSRFNRALRCLWVHPTRAVALDYMTRCDEADVSLMVFCEDGGHLTLTVFEVTDRKVHVFDSLSTTVGDRERVDDAVWRLLSRCAPSLAVRVEEVLCVSDDPGFTSAVRKGFDDIWWEVDWAYGPVEVRCVDPVAVARGASCLAQVTMGFIDAPLLLDATSAAISVRLEGSCGAGIESRRVACLWRHSSVPVSCSWSGVVPEGSELVFEVDGFDGDAVTYRYPEPFGADAVRQRSCAGGRVEVGIGVNDRFDVRLWMSCEGRKTHVDMGDLW